MNERLFDCPKCNKQPDDAFARFESCKDWFIAYPKEQTIHIHFGEPTTSESENIKEATLVNEFLDTTIKNNPGTNFCLMIDLTTIDDSELVPPEAMIMYIKMFSREQIGLTIAYGMQTFGMKDIIKLLNAKLAKKIKVAQDYQEATSICTEWINNN